MASTGLSTYRWVWLAQPVYEPPAAESRVKPGEGRQTVDLQLLPSGEHLMGGLQGGFTLWDAGGRITHRSGATKWEVSRGGRYILLAGPQDRTEYRLDLATKELLPTGIVRASVESPLTGYFGGTDDTYLFSLRRVESGPALRVFDAGHQREIALLPLEVSAGNYRNESDTFDFRWAPESFVVTNATLRLGDTRLLAFLPEEGFPLGLWDVAGGRLLGRLRRSSNGRLLGHAVSGDDRLAATTEEDGVDASLSIWDLETGEARSHVKVRANVGAPTFSPEDTAVSVRTLPEGRLLAFRTSDLAPSQDTSRGLWDEPAMYPGDPAPAWSGRVSLRLAAPAALWDTGTTNPLLEIPEFDATGLSGLRVSRDRRRMVVQRGSLVELWSLRPARKLAQLGVLQVRQRTHFAAGDPALGILQAGALSVFDLETGGHVADLPVAGEDFGLSYDSGHALIHVWTDGGSLIRYSRRLQILGLAW